MAELTPGLGWNVTLRATTLEAARSAVADCWLGHANRECATGPSQHAARLGAVMLRPHQLDAIQQLTEIIEANRGAVLADAVGMGKTYVALALGARVKSVLVVCPAALRELWYRSARETGVRITCTSVEQLSRTSDPRNASSELIIVDEAHHFRNPHTRRYRALARLTARTRVLLLSATPIHNRLGDLAALLSLFLGAHAWTLTEEQRARFIVRRDHQAIHGSVGRSIPSDQPHEETPADLALAIPEIVGPRIVRIDDDPRTLQAIVDLPPPVPPRDGEIASALTAMGLTRQWASSAGALEAALRRRLERSVALEASLERGVHPSYRDLRSWCVGEGAIQLALPELLMSNAVDECNVGHGDCRDMAAGLLEAVRAHAAGVRELLRHVAANANVDATRADRLREIASMHAGAKIVAFSAFEDTIHTLFRHLRRDGEVCALSAKGGAIAGGCLRRADVIQQFAPNTGDRVPRAERIRLLLATDLLSEGMNLQAAAAVVHLDLPWTPARLEQRVGRVARMGSPHDRVYAYAFAPPASSETLLRVEARLRAKLDAAGRAVGIAGSIVPRLSPCVSSSPGALERQPDGKHTGPPEHMAVVRSVVSTWHRAAQGTPSLAETLWSAAAGPTRGFLAACVAGGRRILVADTGSGPTESPAVLAMAVQAADCAVRASAPNTCDDIVRQLQQWWSEQCASDDAGLSTIAGVAMRRRVLRRIAAIARRAPLHTRPAIFALSDRARQAATAPYGAGAEWVLDHLARADLPDAQWLRAIAAFGDAHASRARELASDRELRVSAVIVFSQD